MREYVEKALHKSRSRARRRLGLPLYLRGLYSPGAVDRLRRAVRRGLPRRKPDGEDHGEAPRRPEAAPGDPVAFALEGATGYRVGRMLEAGLPFIEPSGQVYLPFLGIALSSGRSRAAAGGGQTLARSRPRRSASRSWRSYGDLDGASVTQAAGLLGAAKMTASRAFDEPAAADPRSSPPRGGGGCCAPAGTRWRCGIA